MFQPKSLEERENLSPGMDRLEYQGGRSRKCLEMSLRKSGGKSDSQPLLECRNNLQNSNHLGPRLIRRGSDASIDLTLSRSPSPAPTQFSSLSSASIIPSSL